VAFSALPKNQGVYQWIPAAEAANIGALRKKLNVYIVDRWGIPTRQAIGAFCSQGLVDELIAWECQGVGLGTFRSSFDDERSYNASFKAALTELADLVASDRLIVPGLDKKKIAINLQTGLRPISVLQNELFRLPLPLESQVDVAPPKIRKAGGKPSFFEWGPPMMAASIQFGGEQYLERRGLTTEISKFIRIYLANTKLYPDEPAKSTLDEKASLVIREIQKHRNKKASE